MNYALKPSYFSVRPLNNSWLLHDLDREQERSLSGHILAQDYFGTLATVLSLMSQEYLQKQSPDPLMIDEVLEELKFLQSNYLIKEKNDST